MTYKIHHLLKALMKRDVKSVLLDELLVLPQQLPDLREVLPLRLGGFQEPREALLPVLLSQG